MARVNKELNLPSGKTGQRPSRTRGKDWVRKNVVMDQRKLDVARRVLGVETETEAIDVALDLVAFRRELVRGIAAVRRAGGIEDVFEKRQACSSPGMSVRVFSRLGRRFRCPSRLYSPSWDVVGRSGCLRVRCKM